LQADARAMVQSADALQSAIEQGIQGPFNGGLNALPNGTARRMTRGKIEADPELQSFIRARILTQTFPQVTAAVAAHFPPDRRVGMSSIHRWWHRLGKHSG
jgi:hypothetical protein